MQMAHRARIRQRPSRLLLMLSLRLAGASCAGEVEAPNWPCILSSLECAIRCPCYRLGLFTHEGAAS